MLIVAFASYLVNWGIPLVSSMLVAIIFGVILRNTKLIPYCMEAGLRFSAKTILRTGVVLLGLKLSIPQVIGLGPGPILVIVATVLGTFLATICLGKVMRLAHTTTLLTATGTSICGAAAVAGMTAVTHRRGETDTDVDDAAATAIASVTLFGTIGLVLFPLFAQELGLTLEQTGVWLGAAIHEVGQVVAAAGIAGDCLSNAEADALMKAATITKLGRVATLAIMVAIMGILEQRAVNKMDLSQTISQSQDSPSESVSNSNNTGKTAGKSAPLLPLFVVGFLAMVVLRSGLEWTIGIPAGSVLQLILTRIDMLATFLLTVAMGAMGAGVNLKTIAKSGIKALILGLLAATLAALISLGLTLVTV